MPEIEPPDAAQRGRFSSTLFLALFLPVAAVVLVLGLSFASLRSESEIKEIIERDNSRLYLISGFVGAPMRTGDFWILELERSGGRRPSNKRGDDRNPGRG